MVAGEVPTAGAASSPASSPSTPGIRKATIRGVGETRPSSLSESRQEIIARADSTPKVLPAPKGKITSAPNEQAAGQSVPSEASVESRAIEPLHSGTEQPVQIFVDDIQKVASENRLVVSRSGAASESSRQEIVNEEFKLPTKSVPRWAVASVIVTALVVVGVVTALTNQSEHKAPPPAPSASSVPDHHKIQNANSAHAPSPSVAPSAKPRVPAYRRQQPSPPSRLNHPRPQRARQRQSHLRRWLLQSGNNQIHFTRAPRFDHKFLQRARLRRVLPRPRQHRMPHQFNEAIRTL